MAGAIRHALGIAQNGAHPSLRGRRGAMARRGATAGLMVRSGGRRTVPRKVAQALETPQNTGNGPLVTPETFFRQA